MSEQIPREEFLGRTLESGPRTICAYARDILVTFGEELPPASPDTSSPIFYAKWPYFDHTLELFGTTNDDATKYVLRHNTSVIDQGSCYNFQDDRDIVSVTHGYTSTHKNQSTTDFTQTEVLNPRQGSQWVAHLLRTNHGHLLMPNRGYIEHTVPQPIPDREMEAELFGMEHGDTITNAIEQAILFETISIDAMAANYSRPQWRYVPKTAAGIATPGSRAQGHATITRRHYFSSLSSY